MMILIAIIAFFFGLLVSVNLVVSVFFLLPKIKKLASTGEMGTREVLWGYIFSSVWVGLVVAVAATVLIQPVFDFLLRNRFYHGFVIAITIFSVKFINPRQRNISERQAEKIIENYKKRGKWTLY
jgi:ABC-type Fe3+ transport system permease subunit